MKRALLTLAAFAILIAFAGAQTNDFTYQGALDLSGEPANGTFDFEFRLFDAENGGAQVSTTATRTGITVADGRFTVSLAFAGGFPGADRWLEIWVRPAGGGGFQQLLPRVKIGSSPYAVKSLSADNAANATNAATANNALNLGGVAANQYVQTADPRMTDARTPTAGSANYIQNQDAGVQASSRFNISGSGMAGGTLSGNTLNATTQLNINGIRAFTINGQFSAPGFPLGPSNTFAGAGAGISTVPDPNSSFSAGKQNSFFGVRSGIANVTGYGNSFHGFSSGEANTSGNFNSFFGLRAGESNTNGNNNSFFGPLAGIGNTGGDGNTFVGRNAGSSNTLGDNNTALGYLSDVTSGLQYAAAIGAGSVASQSNSVFLGRPGGEDTVRIPGNLNLTGAASLNGDLVVATGGLSVFNGNVVIPTLGSAGSTSLCRNASNILATCSSSLRYKTNINPFASGLDLIRRLRPITFDWKDGGLNDLGLGAEDVAAIDPLLVTYNKDGQVEGVKYDRIGVVLVNAVKEQQRQIDDQRKEIQALRAALCELNPQLGVCNSQEKK